jgi:hypothetical protein
MKVRFGLGLLAYLLPTFALGFIWHLMLFHGYYERLALYRKDIIIPFGFLSMLIQAFVFAWVYQQAFAQRNGSPLSLGSGYVLTSSTARARLSSIRAICRGLTFGLRRRRTAPSGTDRGRMARTSKPCE